MSVCGRAKVVKAKRSTKSENISASYNKFKEFEETGMKEGVTNGITIKVSGKKKDYSCSVGNFLLSYTSQGRPETGDAIGQEVCCGTNNFLLVLNIGRLRL